MAGRPSTGLLTTLKQMRQQWLHGFLDVCLPSLLADRRDYGRGPAERLAEAGFGEVPGGTPRGRRAVTFGG